MSFVSRTADNVKRAVEKAGDEYTVIVAEDRGGAYNGDKMLPGALLIINEMSDSVKPRILITPCLRMEPYIEAINKSGGEAVICDEGEIDLSFDGLLLSGGPDVHPSYYGEEINGSVNIDEGRDKSEFAVVKAYTDMKKPVLAICRGCQLINIFFGGTLYQDLPNSAEHSSGSGCETSHGGITAKGSLARKLLGEAPVLNSYHHQAIKEPGEGFEISIMSADNSVIEGVEHKSLPIWAYQCHPERMCYSSKREGTTGSSGIFIDFINRCR